MISTNNMEDINSSNSKIIHDNKEENNSIATIMSETTKMINLLINIVNSYREDNIYIIQ